MNFVQIAEFDWLAMATVMLNLRKNIKKSTLRSHNGDEAETL